MRPPLAALLLAATLGGGCAARADISGDPAAPYREVHQDWTRELRLTHSFELDLLLRATLLHTPVLEAQASYLSAARLEDTERASRRLLASLEEGAEYVVVFASYSPKDDARGFDGDDSEAWTLQLSVDGRPQPFVSAERIRQPDAELLALYPQHNRWSELWVARFERVDEGRELRLTVAGVHGRGALVWVL